MVSSSIRWLIGLGVGLIAIGFALAFSLPDNYEQNRAHAKLAILWNYIVADNGKPGSWYNPLVMIALFTRDDSVTGSANQDTMPGDRYKLIHTVGAIAKAKFVYVDNPYTGMFKAANNVLVRLSVATETEKDNMIPALSIKALRDGMYSANTIAMHELIGWSQLNWFQDVLCNHIAENPNYPLKLILLGNKFKKASAFPGSLGLSEWAEYTESGTKVTSPKFPWALLYQPNPALKAKMEGNTNTNVGNILTKITTGNEVLYKIFAIDDPKNPQPRYIGYLQLTSAFRESKFSDLNLFFKHTFIEKDFAYTEYQERHDWFRDATAKRWETESQARYKSLLPAWTNPN